MPQERRCHFLSYRQTVYNVSDACVDFGTLNTHSCASTWILNAYGSTNNLFDILNIMKHPKLRPAETEKSEAKTQNESDKDSLLKNKRSAGSGDKKTTIYPKKMGYHGKDQEKDLNPEE